MPSPNPSSTYNSLASVSCVSSTSCKAVGNYTNGSTGDVLIESWNGSSWSLLAGAEPSSTYNALQGVACTSSTACIAVGVSNDSSVSETLIETWNGTSWSTVSSPDPSSSFNYLSGVTCVTATACTAVGQSDDSINTPDTLVETNSLAPPEITGFSPASGSRRDQGDHHGIESRRGLEGDVQRHPATISKDTATKITVKVPSGATTGKISVTTAAGTATSTSKFKVT